MHITACVVIIILGMTYVISVTTKFTTVSHSCFYFGQSISLELYNFYVSSMLKIPPNSLMYIILGAWYLVSVSDLHIPRMTDDILHSIEFLAGWGCLVAISNFTLCE